MREQEGRCCSGSIAQAPGSWSSSRHMGTKWKFGALVLLLVVRLLLLQLLKNGNRRFGDPDMKSIEPCLGTTPLDLLTNRPDHSGVKKTVV